MRTTESPALVTRQAGGKGALEEEGLQQPVKLTEEFSLLTYPWAKYSHIITHECRGYGKQNMVADHIASLNKYKMVILKGENG